RDRKYDFEDLCKNEISKKEITDVELNKEKGIQLVPQAHAEEIKNENSRQQNNLIINEIVFDRKKINEDIRITEKPVNDWKIDSEENHRANEMKDFLQRAQNESKRRAYILENRIIEINRNITENEMWYSGNTYLISSNVSIMGCELTIMPGAVILFEKDTSLIVGTSGRLIARGDRVLPITFAKAAYDNESFKEGYYQSAVHVKKDSMPNSIMENLKISSAKAGIKMERPIDGPLKNCFMEHCAEEIENLIE
ncbi:MAG: hypothetical protein JW928_01060, partial [Candidatus Aureabacteria bacterium]|nr:hypothetical protein [Candidatus Auribacterota bacterium]